MIPNLLVPFIVCCNSCIAFVVIVKDLSRVCEFMGALLNQQNLNCSTLLFNSSTCVYYKGVIDFNCVSSFALPEEVNIKQSDVSNL